MDTGPPHCWRGWVALLFSSFGVVVLSELMPCMISADNRTAWQLHTATMSIYRGIHANGSISNIRTLVSPWLSRDSNIRCFRSVDDVMWTCAQNRGSVWPTTTFPLVVAWENVAEQYRIRMFVRQEVFEVTWHVTETLVLSLTHECACHQ